MSDPIFQFVNPADLVEHPEAHRIPEMSAEEWADFSESVRIRGEITDPVFALRNGKVFDGRHRLRASKEFGIRLIPVLFYDISEDEALDRMRQSATDRRSLTPAQKVMVNLEFSELLHKLRQSALSAITEAGKYGVEGGRGNTKETPSEGLQKGKAEVAEQIAQLSGTSARNVYKAQAVIREAPDLAAKVKSGEMTINKAEAELKKRKQPESSGQSTQSVTQTEAKIERLRKRKKPEVVAPNPDESALSPNNLLISFTQGKLTPFIEDFLLSYVSAKSADKGTRDPFIEEVRVLFEASFRILAEFGGEKLIETMEEIQDEKAN